MEAQSPLLIPSQDVFRRRESLPKPTGLPIFGGSEVDAGTRWGPGHHPTVPPHRAACTEHSTWPVV